VIGAVSNYLETGGVVLTPEHNREAHDPHDREGEQSQPSQVEVPPLSRLEDGPPRAIAHTLHVPLDEHFGAPETGDPRPAAAASRIQNTCRAWCPSRINELVVVRLDNTPSMFERRRALLASFY
jgi:hypothetical protein